MEKKVLNEDFKKKEKKIHKYSFKKWINVIYAQWYPMQSLEEV